MAWETIKVSDPAAANSSGGHGSRRALRMALSLWDDLPSSGRHWTRVLFSRFLENPVAPPAQPSVSDQGELVRVEDATRLSLISHGMATTLLATEGTAHHWRLGVSSRPVREFVPDFVIALALRSATPRRRLETKILSRSNRPEHRRPPDTATASTWTDLFVGAGQHRIWSARPERGAYGRRFEPGLAGTSASTSVTESPGRTDRQRHDLHDAVVAFIRRKGAVDPVLNALERSLDERRFESSPGDTTVSIRCVSERPVEQPRRCPAPALPELGSFEPDFEFDFVIGPAPTPSQWFFGSGIPSWPPAAFAPTTEPSGWTDRSQYEALALAALIRREADLLSVFVTGSAPTAPTSFLEAGTPDWAPAASSEFVKDSFAEPGPSALEPFGSDVIGELVRTPARPLLLEGETSAPNPEPIVKVGRTAGQLAQPQHSVLEAFNGESVRSYRADLGKRSDTFSTAASTETVPDPQQTLKAPARTSRKSRAPKQLPDYPVPLADVTPHVTIAAAALKPPLLADAPAIVEGWTDLSKTRQRDLRSAVAKAIQIDAVPDPSPALTASAAIPATLSCAYLNARLFRQAHAIYGIKAPEHFSNILHQLRFMLRRLGLHEPPYAGAHTLEPSWRRLHDALPTKHRRIALSGFMRFCSAKAIAPEAVTAETLNAFEAWLLDRTLCDDAPSRARAVASNWTWARTFVPGWPNVELKRPRMREEYVLPFEAYPLSLQEDAQRFLDSLSFSDVGDIFPDDVDSKSDSRAGRSKALKPRTVAGRRFQIRQCLVALLKCGHEPASLTSLRALVDPPEHAHAIMTFYVQRANSKRTSQTGQIAEVLRQIARFHCKLEPEAADRIARWARNATPKQVLAITSKNNRRVRVLLIPKNTRALLNSPDVLMREAEDPSLRPQTAALLAFYAVALALLLRTAMRRSNLAGLRLDQHLQRSTGKLIDSISLEGSETKTGRAMLWPISEKIGKQIEVYIKRFRPLLTQPGNPYLFPQRGMKGRSAHDIAVGLTDLVERRIGCEFNMHLVRHFIAALYLERHSGQYDAVRKLLGHASTSYTTDVYLPLELDALARSLDETLTQEAAPAPTDDPASAANSQNKKQGSHRSRPCIDVVDRVGRSENEE